MQPTASNHWLLQHCVRPYDSSIERDEDTSDETGRNYGNAYHSVMSKWPDTNVVEMAGIYGVDGEELQRHVTRDRATLQAWLAGDNVFQTPFTVVEREGARAMVPGASTWRVPAFDAVTHSYDLRPGEFAGTNDLLITSDDGFTCVLDYKTGDADGGFDNPATLPQMLSLALLTDADAVAIFHTPRYAPGVIYAQPVTREAKKQHAAMLKRQLERIGDGSMTPGKWCRRCPVKGSCPTQDGRLATALTKAMPAVGALAHEVDKGRIHLFLGEFEKAAKRAREILKADVAAGEVIERPDGKVLELVPRTRENVSKSSIIKAYGAARGEEVLEQLRIDGAITVTEYEELKAK